MTPSSTLFRRHNDGTVTDVFEDDCVWVRAGEGTVSAIGSDTPTDLVTCPRTFTALRDAIVAHALDGIVFFHPDGRQAHVMRADFGLPAIDAPAADDDAVDA